MLTGRKSYYDIFFTILTLSWIILGGLLQLIVVCRLLYKRDACLQPIPTSIRILLFFASSILLGPVTVNVYGAYILFRNGAVDDGDIVKYV